MKISIATTGRYCYQKSMTLIMFSILSLFILAGCATSEPKNETIVFENIEKPSVYKFKIINASNTTINDIKYKPCNSHQTQYLQLTDNLRPMEKFSINLYSKCVDLVATNAFKKKLVDVKNVDLQSTKLWTIR